jgi:hypothetical protein
LRDICALAKSFHSGKLGQLRAERGFLLWGMANCPEREDLNTRYRIATLKYGRFVESLKGMHRTDRDEQEVVQLEDEMKETERAFARHQTEHGCRG